MADWKLNKWWKKAIYVLGWVYLVELILAFISGYVGASLGIW
jgi:hypothetical protein